MSRLIDLTGQQFGDWTVLSYAGNRKWNCVCSCGKRKEVFGGDMKAGKTKSCGCQKTEDLLGRRFGKLTVVKRIENNSYNQVQYICVCDCGNEKAESSGHLIGGFVKSCGCLKRVSKFTTHGKRNSRLYNIWANMKQRCRNPNSPSYKNYGGRGITICDEWHNDFQAFYDWAMANGYSDTLTIDRIDNNKGYSPDNCRWVDMKTQCNNKRNNRYKIFNGERKTIKQIAEIIGVSEFTLYARENKTVQK